jgi:transposase-like protein
MVAVQWYLRYALSYRDVEELLAERGITVNHATAYQWVQGSVQRRLKRPGFGAHLSLCVRPGWPCRS